MCNKVSMQIFINTTRWACFQIPRCSRGTAPIIAIRGKSLDYISVEKKIFISVFPLFCMSSFAVICMIDICHPKLFQINVIVSVFANIFPLLF